MGASVRSFVRPGKPAKPATSDARIIASLRVPPMAPPAAG